MITAALTLVLGLIFFFRPGATMAFFARICGILLIVYAVTEFIGKKDRIKDGDNKDLIIALVAGILGLVFLWSPGFLISILPALIGIYLILDGGLAVKEAIDAKRIGVSGADVALVLSIIKLVCGIIILCRPFGSVRLFMRVIGVILIYSGITHLFNTKDGR